MATQSRKTTKQATEQTQEETTQTMNNQKTNHQTSTTHFSESELRQECVKNQAVKDAFSDAKLYIQYYDSAFENLKKTAITNLLQAKIEEQNHQLDKRDDEDFLLEFNPQDVLVKMNTLKESLALPSRSNCRYLTGS